MPRRNSLYFPYPCAFLVHTKQGPGFNRLLLPPWHRLTNFMSLDSFIMFICFSSWFKYNFDLTGCAPTPVPIAEHSSHASWVSEASLYSEMRPLYVLLYHLIQGRLTVEVMMNSYKIYLIRSSSKDHTVVKLRCNITTSYYVRFPYVLLWEHCSVNLYSDLFLWFKSYILHLCTQPREIRSSRRLDSKWLNPHYHKV